jgi:hypothetical protein
VYFKIINGKSVTAKGALRQSYVTALSLLIITAFRTAIAFTLGICFTQYLWYLLRRKALKISLIEELFQIRYNILSLLHPRIIRRAPILFFAASLSWLVPLATIYSPGALTIRTEPRWSVRTVTASLVNPVLEEGNFTLPIGNLSEFYRGFQSGRPGTEVKEIMTYKYVPGCSVTANRN